MHPPRIVVVEDDETLGQFFSMVLEMMPVTYSLCRSGEEALAVLRDAPADVLVTDLLLPGLDGRGLLKALRADVRLRGSARLVVMSGSIDESVRREMEQSGVWRVLCKPVTVKAFKACIDEALATRADETPPKAPEAAESLSAAERTLVETHFAGQTSLFLAYRASSLQQFPRDVEQGDKALGQADVAGLRRVVHNLKGVLMTLGHHAPAQTARELEEAATAWLGCPPGGLAPGEPGVRLPEAITHGWRRLRDELPKADGGSPSSH